MLRDCGNVQACRTMSSMQECHAISTWFHTTGNTSMQCCKNCMPGFLHRKEHTVFLWYSSAWDAWASRAPCTYQCNQYTSNIKQINVLLPPYSVLLCQLGFTPLKTETVCRKQTGLFDSVQCLWNVSPSAYATQAQGVKCIQKLKKKCRSILKPAKLPVHSCRNDRSDA